MRRYSNSLLPALPGTVAVLVVAGALLSDWILYTATIALARGLVVLGLVLMLRMGAVSFGQGMYYCMGAYVCGLLSSLEGITDALVLVAVSGGVCCLAGGVLGVVLAGYRGVFFAMFNLALSMILYGVLLKFSTMGGSDGIGVAAPTYFGFAPAVTQRSLFAYLFIVVLVATIGYVCQRYMRSELGLTSQALKGNEIRLAYLGLSVKRVVVINYTIAAGLAGIGGAMVALVSGHIIPEMAYWTTSGEFVFITVLSGPSSVLAAFAGTALFETVRLVTGQYLPNAWQLLLGSFLLLTILFLPDGIGALFQSRRLTTGSLPSEKGAG